MDLFTSKHFLLLKIIVLKQIILNNIFWKRKVFRSEQVHTCLDSTYASLPKLPTNKAKKADVKKTVPDHLEKVENEICINLGVWIIGQSLGWFVSPKYDFIHFWKACTWTLSNHLHSMEPYAV